jgi:hypothetical protein
LLKRAQLEQRVQKTLKEAPLMAHITQMVMADDHVAAKIGSVGEDPFGRPLPSSQARLPVRQAMARTSLPAFVREAHGRAGTILPDGPTVTDYSMT